MTGDTLPWRSFWITGAGSGIGRALALKVAKTGLKLVLSGRRVEPLEEVGRNCRDQGADVEVLPFDLADQEARERAFHTLADSSSVPEVLINNAGVSQRSPATATSFAVERLIQEVNFTAGVHLTKLVLPHLVAADGGCILAVSSIAGRLAAPLRSSYNAAKAAQIAYYRTLGNELFGTGILVAVAIPGFVRTEVSLNALDGDGKAYGEMDPNQAGGISPERAAEDILAGLFRGKRMIYTGVSLKGKVMLALERISPGAADRILRSVEVK
jgi:short-subunit dehydrogenase